MGEYYLISQLPSLDGLGETAPVPMTEDRFRELCTSFLGKKALRELEKLSLMPARIPEKSTSSLIQAWNDGERNLRLALGKIRAEKMNKQFICENNALPVALVQAARTATEAESPLEAERLLHRYRLDFLETLRPMDGFSEDFIFYYFLKLKLILRIRQFDAESGETAYRSIYRSLVSEGRSEVM